MDKGYTNDSCRRWIAQIPLIFLSLAFLLVIFAMSRIWQDKFQGPTSGGPAEGGATTVNTAVRAANMTKCSCDCHTRGEKKAKPCLVSLGSVIRNALR